MEQIRIQDDLYNYINQEWLEKAVIPDDRPTAGGFAELDKGVEKLLTNDFIQMSESKNYPNEYMKNAGYLFDLIRDTERRNHDGIAPILPTLKKIDEIKDLKEFNEKIAELVTDGIPMPFRMSVEEDMMDTNHYCFNIAGPSVFLPDSAYYKEENAAKKKMFLTAWKNMAKSVIALTGLSKAKQSQYIKDAIAFDEMIAVYVKNMEEWSDYVKNYNPMPMEKVCNLMKTVAFKKLTEEIFDSEVNTVIVNEPRYFKGFKKVFHEDTFVLYKHWAYVSLLLESTSLLSEELRELGSSYRLAIMGVKSIPDIDKFAYTFASKIFSEPVGLYYGKTYFGEEAKRDVIEMVKQIVETYKNRISRNDFLSASTKEKAILKLEMIGLKLAYPDKIDPIFDQFQIDPSMTLFENVYVINKKKRLNEFQKFGTVVDRTKWVMPGHVVNACYNPSLNDITFPAAILQAPFYSIKQSRSENLGGIGAVIAHEISHAFDNNGAAFDENGNLNNWWTKEDQKNFKERTKAMVKEFDKIELPWGTVNGKFIVSENIADNGGMGATLEVMSHTEDANYEEYFASWAKIWCMKAKPEYLQLLLSIDVHAPNILRANMQPRNFEEWYTTFGVTKSDKMYLAPNKRVTIW